MVSPRLALAALLLMGSTAAAQTPATRPGVPPQGMSCPVSHPIKGNFTTYSGERCIHHMAERVFLRQDKARAVLHE